MNTSQTMHDPSDPQGPPRDLRRDAGGLALFALAIFLGVSVVMAARRPEPEVGGTTALVTGLVGWLGVWPLLLLSACLGLLGARLWVAGVVAGLLRNTLWSLGLCLSVSLLFGAGSSGSGGSFGDITGANLSQVLSGWVGIPLAVALVGAVVWFAWLRPPEWKAALSPGEPAPSIFTPSDSEGLTTDEAEALLPEETPPASITGRSIPVAPDLPPLYPPDVRREGRIPEGARPLEARDESATRTETESPARPALAHASAGVAGEPVAEPARGHAHQAAPVAVQPPAQSPAAVAGGSAVEDLAPAVPRWERPRNLTPVSVEPAAVTPPPSGTGIHILSVPVRSAWEVALDEEPEQDELPAAEPAAVAVEPEVEQEDLEDEDSLETEDEDLDLEEDGEETLLAQDDDEVLEEEDATDEAEEADLEDSDLESDEAGAFEDELDAEEDEQAWSAASAPAATQEVVAEVAAPEAPSEQAAWEQPSLFDDEPVDAYGTPVTLVEALRQANQDTVARIAEPAPVEEAPAPTVAEVVEDEPALELQPKPRPAAVLPPEPAPQTRPRKPVAAAETEPADDLVFRAGMLFLERGRVAVSMLQRTFDLDFKEATALLDQLQQAGLIGPYLGGQKRDLLLTVEEWRERRVGAS